MKFQVTMKDTDVLLDSIQEAVDDSLMDSHLSEGDCEAVADGLGM